MSYLVFCTFDLKNASSKEYIDAYADLEALGLKRVHKDKGKESVIPTTAAMGFFTGTDASKVCTHIRDAVTKSFKARGFKSELFFVVGNDWAWVGAVT